jgi:hypothetical protein
MIDCADWLYDIFSESNSSFKAEPSTKGLLGGINVIHQLNNLANQKNIMDRRMVI